MIRSARPSALLLQGDEAIALGALHAGISAAYSYPGTPSTEIFESIEREARRFAVTAHWTANEKTAYEAALGVSMVGRRAIVSMRSVGLNVAADPFVNSAMVGIRGGLVVAVADDPAMHSSQNEQDTRILADFARVPCLEPADPQQAYAMAREAFDLSERFRVPVVLRLVTRLCHGRGVVTPGSPRAPNPLAGDGADHDWLLLPGHARRLWRELLDTHKALERFAERWPENVLQLGDGPLPKQAGTFPEPAVLDGWPCDAPPAAGAPERDGWPAARDGRLPLGVITSGTGRNHYLENARDLATAPPHLHVAGYPLPVAKVHALAALVETVLVIEEGFPFVERQLTGLLSPHGQVKGKESGSLPATGELTPDAVREALGLPHRPSLALEVHIDLPERPPHLCSGCPHQDAYVGLGEALKGLEQWLVTGDIGCYTLGALPPYETLQSCVSMGASIGMAKGAADVGRRQVLAVIGDSTLLHSGLTPLLDAIVHDTDITVLILDNDSVAMTGKQPPLLTSEQIGPVLLGLGVAPEHLRVLRLHPSRVHEVAAAVREEMQHDGLSVVLAARESAEAAFRRKRGRHREVAEVAEAEPAE